MDKNYVKNVNWRFTRRDGNEMFNVVFVHFVSFPKLLNPSDSSDADFAH